eukprot:XP_019928086.1 PREDICTED: uncharacterized protein LOC109620343 [Crassostrea gigas]
MNVEVLFVKEILEHINLLPKIFKLKICRTEYKYAVVEFLDERGVESDPVRWLTNDEKECFWSQFKTKNSTKTTLAIKVAIQPTKEFSKFPVRVYKKYLEYDTARKNLDKATYASDFQTEAEYETYAF